MSVVKRLMSQVAGVSPLHADATLGAECVASLTALARPYRWEQTTTNSSFCHEAKRLTFLKGDCATEGQTQSFFSRAISAD